MRSDRHARPRAYAVLVILCLALLVLLTFIQVAHVHSVNTDADHCPLCMVLHTAAPIAAAIIAILMVQLAAVTPIIRLRPVRMIGNRQLFIRPPPGLPAASF
jgi:hypothetical protein